jgi:ABC-type multidrug transport system fused ATPase/permease subunit
MAEKKTTKKVTKKVEEEIKDDSFDLDASVDKISAASKKVANKAKEAITEAFDNEEGNVNSLKLPKYRSSNSKLIESLRIVAIVLAAIGSIGSFFAIWGAGLAAGSGFSSFFGGIFVAAFAFVVSFILITLGFSVLRNIATITDNIQYISRKLDKLK